MMNRRTIGWIVAIALGASGTALADTQSTRSQSQRTTSQPSQQSGQQAQQSGETSPQRAQQQQQEQTFPEDQNLEQRTRETTVGAPKTQEREASDVSREASASAEQRPSTAMRLEERVEAIKLAALEKEEAVEVQTKLQDLGYYKGNIDGIVGRQTRAALQRYFGDQAALAARGMAGSAALVSLGIDESAIQRVRGREQESQTERGTPSSRRTQGSDAGMQAPGAPSDQSRKSEPRTLPPPTTRPEKMEPYPAPEHQHTPGTEQSGPK
jgi:hypothetical protein